MNLTFSLGGAASDPHDHDAAPTELPLAVVGNGGRGTAPLNALDVQVTCSDGEVVAVALSGDGVSYARASRPRDETSVRALAGAVRSVIARAGAELGEPLLSSVSAVVLDLGDSCDEVLRELGLDASAPEVTEPLQARTGIRAGTPIRCDRNMI